MGAIVSGLSHSECNRQEDAKFFCLCISNGTCKPSIDFSTVPFVSIPQPTFRVTHIIAGSFGRSMSGSKFPPTVREVSRHEVINRCHR